MIIHHLNHVVTLALSNCGGASLLTKEMDGRTKIIGRLKRGLDAVSNPKRHMGVVRSLRPDAFAVLTKIQPQLPFKYLHPLYLVRGLSTEHRASAVMHHYDFLNDRFETSCLASIFARQVCLWDHDAPQGKHQVRLVFSHPTDNEGELTLQHEVDGLLVYLLSFSFVPGWLVRSSAKTVILITRVQGMSESSDLIRRAMRSINGLGSARLLVAALQGIANTLQVSELAGVSGEAQVCFSPDLSAIFDAAYDEFFSSLGGVRASSAYYRLTLPLFEKCLSNIKPGNRTRTRAQRAIKRVVTDCAARSIEVR